MHALLPACSTPCVRHPQVAALTPPSALPRSTCCPRSARSPSTAAAAFPALQLRGLPYAQVEKEISEGRRQLAACGVPVSDIVGFRSPLLEADSNMRRALSKLGFLYDRRAGLRLRGRAAAAAVLGMRGRRVVWGCGEGRGRAAPGSQARCAAHDGAEFISKALPSPTPCYCRSTILEETTGNSVSKSASQRVWPFSMDAGVPLNCAWFGGIQSCSAAERWRGLFEVRAVVVGWLVG